jgi:hypothetical protein
MLCLDTDLGVLGSGAATLFARKPYAGIVATQTIVNNTNGGDLILIADEDNTRSRSFWTNALGIQKYILANTSYLEAADLNGVTNFSINGGFGVASSSLVNATGGQYVSFAWKEAPLFMDVVPYTGNGTSQTINHNLGISPKWILFKNLDNTDDWGVYESGQGENKYLTLNTTANPVLDLNFMGGGSPSSTQFTVGSLARVNRTACRFVAYLFAELAGQSKFSFYSGTGTTTQQDIVLGFQPSIVIIKNTTGTAENWLLAQSAKGWILNSTAQAFNISTTRVALSATGFSIGGAGSNANGDYNNSGVAYSYAAWR